MRTDRLFIAGLGTRVPELFPVAEAVRQGLYDARTAEADGWRSVAVAGSEPAPELAARAGALALRRSGVAAADIALLIHAGTYHQGPDLWYAPQYLQRRLLPASTVPAFALHQGCTGILDAVQLAHGYLTAHGGAGAALVTGADNYGTPLFDRWTYAAGWRTGRGSVLGDAGSAVVLSAHTGPLRVRAVASSSLPGWEELYRGDERLHPPGATAGTPLALGSRMAAYAARHPGAAERVAADLARARTALARQVLDEAGVKASDVTRVTHVFTGHPRYLRTLLDPLGIDPARGLLELGRTLGHLGVNDQLVGLAHLLETDAVGPGDHILMMGNGVGISLACALVEVIARPGWKPNT
ncbi:ketoacyl-ACP synthase III family protein [Streptomyces sp. NPDC006733]|uniref:ketoacyl-ACP synthase III family protein n=1 Tax=Streptomyces sp. NPDC006733 TaxID=3155460 RepID=UPI0033DE55DD